MLEKSLHISTRQGYPSCCVQQHKSKLYCGGLQAKDNIIAIFPPLTGHLGTPSICLHMHPLIGHYWAPQHYLLFGNYVHPAGMIVKVGS
jgi:hypothetical protein